MENNKESFHYTYSAEQQAEIKRIRKKYVKAEEDKMERLRRLDASVTGTATAVSLVFGILGTLILGLGMSFIMSDLQEILGSHRDLAMPLGLALGLIGVVLVSLAYPLYQHVTRKARERVAPEIIRLTDELMK
ncbi:MAG: MotA/TolQ/ExbB proton channel family protein [Clostridia bacterium]|nr:MotA/TolQ/ExbB proton channel family protein [Clostridia bacterium]